LSTQELSSVKDEYPVDPGYMEEFEENGWHGAAIGNPPFATQFWEAPQLCQIIYCPFYDVNKQFSGILLGGRSDANKAYYDEISTEMIPSFVVFANQMTALYHNIDSQQTDARRARQLEKLNWELFQENMERLQAEKALRESENRYRRIFDSSTVSMWEEDANRLIRAIDALKNSGISDFKQYLKDNPGFVDEAAKMVTTRNVNAATLGLWEIKHKSDMLGSLENFITDNSRPGFEKVLIAIADGELRFESRQR